MKKRVIFLIIIAIVAVIALYFTFFYARKCPDKSCFSEALNECSRVSYVNDASDAAWFYQIKGKSGNECKVYVKLLTLKEGGVDISKLEGKDMLCLIPLLSIKNPEDELSRCHGLLKEEMQELIINKLHAYIVGNLGQINEELNKAI